MMAAGRAYNKIEQVHRMQVRRRLNLARLWTDLARS
jgi:hypothetical protein